MALHGPPFVHPLEPRHHGGHSARRVHRLGQDDRDAGDPVDVLGVLGVVQCRLELTVLLAPVGCPVQQRATLLRPGAVQSPPEQVPEQRVVPVPLALPVQGHQEQVLGLQTFELTSAMSFEAA